RLGVFVDVQNMFYSAKYQYRSKLDFSKLLDHAVGGRDLVRAIAYLVQTPDIDQTNFIAMLQSTGYEVRTKSLRLRPDGTAKGDWDMGIALDTITLAARLDTIVLVTGDGDFVDLVSLLRAQGVRVEVLAFPYSTAEELKASASEFRSIGPQLLLSSLPSNAPIMPAPDAEMGGSAYQNSSSRREFVRSGAAENSYTAAAAQDRSGQEPG
ncbi:MAG: NYN domain-containing protein, partial [Armatimonadota bacterium]|nr:NYN domain-containing protein [Armatimonadota bacterium]